MPDNGSQETLSGAMQTTLGSIPVVGDSLVAPVEVIYEPDVSKVVDALQFLLERRAKRLRQC